MTILKADILRHRIFLFGILLLVISLPASKFGMSLAQILLAANWLIDKRVLVKFKEFFANKVALAFSLLFFVHLIWLANTVNFTYAFDDLRTKSPIFILAVIFSTTPMISGKEFRVVLSTHVFSVFLMSLISVYIYFVQHPADFRQISPFISHIRLSLHVCVALFTLLFFLYNDSCFMANSEKMRMFANIGLVGLILWFLNFLSLLQSVTGFGIVIVILGILWLRNVAKSSMSGVMKKGITVLVLLLPVAIAGVLFHSFNDYMVRPVVDVSKLEKFTSHGGEYRHDTIHFIAEDQRWIGLYFCEPELISGWNMRSHVKYNTLDAQGNVVNNTLMRYLTSKDLRKDYDGVNALTDKDVRNIEQGIANVNYVKGIGIVSRMHKLFWEYLISSSTGDVKGHSMLQRIELWKTSVSIIKGHWIAGVGTGDLPDTFKRQLEMDDSSLKDTRMRSHNQYLSLCIAFGFFGFLLCLFAFLYPFYKNKQFTDYFSMVFLLVFFVSMLTEDTIESQDGVTFYAFFAALYLFQKPIIRTNLKKKHEKNETV